MSLTNEPQSRHDPGQVWLTLTAWQEHTQLGWLLRSIDHVSSCFLFNPFSSAVSPQVPVATVTGPCPSGATRKLGQQCWRCDQAGHIGQECPLMEL